MTDGSLYAIALSDAKSKIKSNTGRRFDYRIKQLEFVINQSLKYNNKNISGTNFRYVTFTTPFTLNKEIKKYMKIETLKSIEKWKGQKKKEFTDKTDCFKKTRIWWNRSKPGILGKIVFAPIIFDILFKFIMNGNSSSSRIKLILFIHIFIDILNADIRFPRAGPKPIICNQCLLIKGVFKENCKQLIQFDSNIKWKNKQPKPTSYQHNPTRAKETVLSYINCLKELIVCSQSFTNGYINTIISYFDNKLIQSETKKNQYKTINSGTNHTNNIETKLMNQLQINNTNHYNYNTNHTIKQEINGNDVNNIKAYQDGIFPTPELSAICSILVPYEPVHKQYKSISRWHPFNNGTSFANTNYEKYNEIQKQTQKHFQSSVIQKSYDDKSLISTVTPIFDNSSLSVNGDDDVHDIGQNQNDGTFLFGFPVNSESMYNRNNPYTSDKIFICIDDNCVFRESGYSYYSS
eukprot:542601_1